MNNLLTPGMLVTNPNEAEWGVGQVQSNIGNKITVNFEHCGKLVLDGDVVVLIPTFER